MKLIKWTEQVQDRLKWKAIVEKTKTLSELSRKKRKRFPGREKVYPFVKCVTGSGTQTSLSSMNMGPFDPA
jgi:hypothetical protein